jgi:hypothetical protein
MVRIHPDPPVARPGRGAGSRRIGAVAQLGEHLLCKQGVTGSIPVSSTSELMMKKAQESEAARFALFWLLRKLERSPIPAKGGHIGSLKIREVEGGVLEGAFPLLYWDCRPQGHPGLCIASCTPYLKGWSAQRALTRIPCGFGVFAGKGRLQSYRVKRISACGGCLGDNRR